MQRQEPFYVLRELKDQVDVWIRARLWAQVVAGLILGLLVGYLLGPDMGLVLPEAAERVTAWLALPGNIFLGLISMVLVPLVVSSIVKALTGSQSAEELKRVGSRVLLDVLGTTTVAGGLGISLARRIEPGGYVQFDAVAEEVTEAPRPDIQRRSVPEAIAQILPANPAVAVTERDMLAIVLLAAILGLACRVVSQQKVRVVYQLVDAMLEISMRVVKWAMFLTPYAVFGLMAQLIARVGISTVLGMTAYILTVLIGLAVLLSLYVILVGLWGRNPLRFLADVADPVVLAFSTSSSTAVMPLSIDTAVKKLRCPESVANLIIPLGATINMAGTALYQSVAVIFMAQVAGIELSVADQTMIVVTLVASSIGAPGTPGVGVVILANIAASFGIPAVALPLVLGVDRILDMCRTAVNLTGDLTGCVLIGTTRGASARTQ